MRRILIPALTLAGIGLPLCASLSGQMHKVAAPEEVVRAVGVYEWTGDRAKPTASRLIPVSIFINGKLEDAGEYLARPVPLALGSGTVYEVDRAGVSEGLVDLQYASHLNASGSGATDQATNFDDGWFGYGTFATPPPPKKTVALKESKRPSQIQSSKPDTAKADPDRPSFSHKPDAASASDKTTAQTPAASSGTTAKAGDTTDSKTDDDPDRPHLVRKPEQTTAQDGTAQTTAGGASAKAGDSTAKTGDSSSTTTADTSASKNDDDPDRPHLIRKPESTTAAQDSGTAPAATASTETVPADDPDRPTLKKRSPEEAKKAKREASESSASGLATSLNDDPNRPTLHRGKGQQAVTEAEFPKLKGVPTNLHQAVAVSDAKTRPAHDFSRPWEDDTEKATILAKMQEMARAQIASYRGKAVATPTAKATSVKPTPNSKLRRPKAAALPPPEPLMDEELKGYTLSYGGAATYVYTAHTSGEGATLIYVTVVAQMNALGTLEPAIQSVTDAAHLDRTPEMRLVDVVDAEASNRASLLFELREKDSRQFALYRVIAARSEQTFLTGTTQ